MSCKSVAGSEELHTMGPEEGESGANMLKPLLPLRLNFTGIALPALTMLSTGGLLTGWKNPVKL